LKNICLLLFLVFTSCQSKQEQSTFSPEEAEKNIQAVYTQFTKAYQTLDVRLMKDLYLEDALYLTPGKGPIQKGHAEFIPGFESMFQKAKEEKEQLNIQFKFIKRSIQPTIAYDVGYYKMSRTDSLGASRSFSGKFTTILVRQKDNSWKFSLDTYNSAKVEDFDAL